MAWNSNLICLIDFAIDPTTGRGLARPAPLSWACLLIREQWVEWAAGPTAKVATHAAGCQEPSQSCWLELQFSTSRLVHMARLGLWRYGGVMVVGLDAWQLASERAKAEAAKVSEGWALKLSQCYFCLILSVEAGDQRSPGSRGKGAKAWIPGDMAHWKHQSNLRPQWEIKQNPNRKTDNGWEQIIHIRNASCQHMYKNIFNPT